MGLDVEEFEDKYVRRVGARKSLKEFPTGDCVFFDGQTRKCTVYEARPRQCRTWPFWDSNLKSPDDWKHTCSVCPGSGKGQLHHSTRSKPARRSSRSSRRPCRLDENLAEFADSLEFGGYSDDVRSRTAIGVRF